MYGRTPAPVHHISITSCTATSSNLPFSGLIWWEVTPKVTGGPTIGGGTQPITRTNATIQLNPGSVPGVYTLTARPGGIASFGGAATVTVVNIEYLDAALNGTTALKVGKWENAFNAGFPVTIKDDFIDLDPDRFYVRVNDQAQKGVGTISIKLSTDSAGSDYDDDETEIELMEEPANSGTFVSANMLMVSNDDDDDFTNATVVADNDKNDRTHKIALGGKAIVKYPKTGTAFCTKEASVPPSLKTVSVSIFILRDKPAATGGVPVIAEASVTNF